MTGRATWIAAAWLAALGLAGAACKNHEPPPTTNVPVMPVTEIKRGQDACKAYVAKVCGCAETDAALHQPCELARALPDAIEVSLSVATNPDSTRQDVVQAHDSVRKIVKECIEQTAKLAAAGCL
jgi:hypothetical protein